MALSGAQSYDLERQVTLLLSGPGRTPDVCVIMIGANDVTHRVPAARSVRLLSEAVRRLRDTGCEVVVGTCPDLGTIEPVYQPLRWLARRLSRELAAAQTIGVLEAGGRTVSLGDLLGPEFASNPRELFGPDNYHPSAEGYATAAMAVLPTLCAALGLWPEDEERPDATRREGDPAGGARGGAGRGGGRCGGVLGAGPVGAAQVPPTPSAARPGGTGGCAGGAGGRGACAARGVEPGGALSRPGWGRLGCAPAPPFHRFRSSTLRALSSSAGRAVQPVRRLRTSPEGRTGPVVSPEETVKGRARGKHPP
ncbi:hypothetical protein GCM10020221_02760 [Streptomyces thioluteus]|uniref:SGNH hydrolase-type esterase domain-containing protein n=1 Tax=Streptomyces thioluteus TaxID=66431 RepID=A0ABN3WBU2_STRTU